MFGLRTLRVALLITVLAIVVNLALSDAVFAQNGRGRGRFIGKKAGKFVNGHDARDGRFDGRGPRRGRFFDRGPRRGRFDGRGPRRRFDGRYYIRRAPHRRHR